MATRKRSSPPKRKKSRTERRGDRPGSDPLTTRSSISSMRSYPAQATAGIRMDLNMNIVLPPPDVMWVAAGFPLEGAHEYPSQDSVRLRERLAKKFAVEPGMVIAANGSNEIIDFSMRAFVEPGATVNTVSPSFSMYEFFARTNGARLVGFPLREGFVFDSGKLAAARGMRIVPTPNNPTGNRFAEREVRRVVEAAARRRPADVVLIDEAYAEYCGQDFTPLVHEFPNVVCLRTFSKVYGLAGLRIGYAIASPPAAELIARVRPPFALNAFSEHFALAMLERSDYTKEVAATTVAQRERLGNELSSRAFKVFPSDTNFLLVRAPATRNATELTASLSRAGIAVKDFSRVPRLENSLRITVGSAEINKLLIEALDSVLRE